MRKPIIVVDTETTGRDPNVNGILTIGLVTLSPTLEIEHPLYLTQYIDPSVHVVEPAALEKNGIDLDEHNKTALPNAEVQMQFHAYVKEVMYRYKMGSEKARFMGYNVKFDLEFIARMQDNFYEDITFPGASIDVMTFVNDLYLDGKHNIRALKLEKVAPLFGIDTGNSHNAMDDAITTAKLYKVLKQMY